MVQLNLPTYNLNIKNGEVFDIIRKKYVRFTPEEYVRQSFVHFLIEQKHFPLSLMSTETPLKLFNTVKRSDITLYTLSGKPLVLVECKAPTIKITKEVFNQISRYNITLKAAYLIVTNGINHFCIKQNPETLKYEFLKDIPDYSSIIEK